MTKSADLRSDDYESDDYIEALEEILSANEEEASQ